MLNTEFEWPSHETLLQLDNWVHHIPYILPQGRTTWVNPNPPKEKEDGEDEDKEENAEPEVEPEVGPSVLSAVVEDVGKFGLFCMGMMGVSISKRSLRAFPRGALALPPLSPPPNSPLYSCDPTDGLEPLPLVSTTSSPTCTWAGA